MCEDIYEDLESHELAVHGVLIIENVLINPAGKLIFGKAHFL